jgi:hypothetical protein
MNETAIIQSLERRVARMEGMLKTLVGAKEKAVWVKVSGVTRLTGWNREKLRQMRINGIVQFKKTDKGFFYNVSSIPQIFIRHENHENTNRNGSVDSPGAVAKKEKN